jgi:hypothetical protein
MTEHAVWGLDYSPQEKICPRVKPHAMNELTPVVLPLCLGGGITSGA